VAAQTHRGGRTQLRTCIPDPMRAQEAIDNMPFAAVARIQVSLWASQLSARQPNEPEWLAPCLEEIEGQLPTEVHIRRMLAKLKHEYYPRAIIVPTGILA
jgi:hypothetical protein